MNNIHLRRSVWQKHKVLSLAELLISARWAYSTDPRDRVFALCGLSHPELGIVPDYQATIEEIYTSSAATVMKQDRSLNLLAFCDHRAERNSKTLPTWCPDWSSKPDELERVLLLWSADPARNTFQASRDTYVGFRMEPETPRKGSWLHISLFTQGIAIGTVKIIGSLASSEPKTDEERFQGLIFSWEKIATKEGILGEEELPEMEKTATLDDRGCANLTTSREGYYEMVHRQLKLEAVEGRRQFFVTSNGLMGSSRTRG
ncbi:hypothetical protein NA56DRAFT_203443 [Hyaloscypha hepaticicola]|uniref:Uncharacterized protein n=1 Tax=Hyaloscypha hepaticicola TaxID=2082293 RepID=A0A2J6PZN1_9HELO|nr:hypothetical protein NA56DRAFT_203443 [Hyaloscypha hepaticicola]